MRNKEQIHKYLNDHANKRPAYMVLFNDFHKSAIFYPFQIKTFKSDRTNNLTYVCSYNGKEIIVSEDELNKLSRHLNNVICKKITLEKQEHCWLHTKKYYNNLF